MFCPKCGKEIPNQAVFCPKCGAPLKAAGTQPAPAPAPAAPAASGNKWVLARSMATPAQRKADKVHLGILLVDLILAGLWLADTLAIIYHSGASPDLHSIYDFVDAGVIPPSVFVLTCVLGLLGPVISSLFLTRHMLKQDGKVNGSILSWLYLIWNAGIYAVLLYIGVRALADDDVVPSALGWLYIACCAVLLALLVYLTVLRFKAARERKSQGIR